MQYSGRVSVDDDKQQHILIDEEVTSANDSKHLPTSTSSMQQGNQYQLSPEELTFCMEENGVSFDQSNVPDNVWVIKRSFTSEGRNKTTGKLEVWKSHDLITGGTVSSVVKIKSGPKCGRIGQVRHFVSLQNKAKTIQFVTIDFYVNHLKSDKDSGLLYIDTKKLEENVFSFGHMSRPMVTAVDDEKCHVMWLLNSKNG